MFKYVFIYIPITVWGVHRVSLWGVPCAPLSLKMEDSKIVPLWSPVPRPYRGYPSTQFVTPILAKTKSILTM